MTSPSTTSSQPSDSSQTPHGASSNGININGEGAVQLPNAPTSVNGPEAASHENNAILDGKHRPFQQKPSMARRRARSDRAPEPANPPRHHLEKLEAK
jgi:hypothetical protein